MREAWRRRRVGFQETGMSVAFPSVELKVSFPGENRPGAKLEADLLRTFGLKLQGEFMPLCLAVHS